MVEVETNSMLFSRNTVELWSSPWNINNIIIMMMMTRLYSNKQQYFPDSQLRMYLCNVNLKTTKVWPLYWRHLHIRHQVVLLVRVDEERGDGEPDEDESTDEGHHPHRDLLGDQGAADHWRRLQLELQTNIPEVSQSRRMCVGGTDLLARCRWCVRALRPHRPPPRR